MDIFKLRFKLGIHEFEAEGSQDYVEAQRDIFLKSIELTLLGPDTGKGQKSAADEGKRPHAGSPAEANSSRAPQNLPISEELMKRIVHQEGELLTLSVMPNGEDPEADALLLLLLAHKVLKAQDLVQATDLLAGMKQSGFSNVDRLDRVMTKLDDSFVTSVGNRKGKKYRLLNPGTTKAKQLAEQLAGVVT